MCGMMSGNELNPKSGSKGPRELKCVSSLLRDNNSHSKQQWKLHMLVLATKDNRKKLLANAKYPMLGNIIIVHIAFHTAEACSSIPTCPTTCDLKAIPCMNLFQRISINPSSDKEDEISAGSKTWVNVCQRLFSVLSLIWAADVLRQV